MYYEKLDDWSPFRYKYYYVDTDERYADSLFIKHKVEVKFLKDYAHPDNHYLIVFCSIKKKDEPEFLAALSELENKMLLMGENGYTKFAEQFIKSLHQAEE